MRRLRIPIAVAMIAAGLVLGLVALGGVDVRTVLANGPWHGPFGGQLPPELEGLHDLPPAERFNHFLGAQLTLKDKDNKPVTVAVTPGKVTAVSASSLTITANDGSTKTYGLTDKTMVRGQPTQSGGPSSQTTINTGDTVVVVTLNNDANARAVITGGKDGFTRRHAFGPGGPFGPGR